MQSTVIDHSCKDCVPPSGHLEKLTWMTQPVGLPHELTTAAKHFFRLYKWVKWICALKNPCIYVSVKHILIANYSQNRKNDEASYEKMLKLRRDLSRAVTILEMIKRREKSKRELLHLTLEIFEKR